MITDKYWYYALWAGNESIWPWNEAARWHWNEAAWWYWNEAAW